ncbi:MAG: hypothetical protein MJ252_06825 [archaeon]|nr:hypothetical protein [archaeon]
MTVSENFRYTKAQGDRICQLKSVGSIVTFDNVYVNLQSQEDPGLIHMDLDNPAHWMPFLTPDAKTKYFPEGVKSVQTDDIIYNPPLADESVLRNRITEELRNAIEKERLAINRTTKWDEVSNDSIRKILERYDSFSMQCTKSMISVNRDIVENVEQSAEEREKLYEEKIKNIEEEKEKLIKDLEDLENKIKGEFVGQKDNIYGFPLNMSFTSMEQIIDTVKLTNIHFAATSEDTLSLTVYVSPLPMNVNSIWIFLAIIKG